ARRSIQLQSCSSVGRSDIGRDHNRRFGGFRPAAPAAAGSSRDGTPVAPEVGMPFSSLVPALVLPLFLGLTAVLGHPKLAPFTAVRWDGDAPEVRVDGTFFGLRSIDGEPIGEILSFAQGRYGERWRKRFTEDLVEVLSDRGTPPGRTVELALVDLET